MPAPDRMAVVVLGMHRSGTSAVAGTAVRLGLAPPRTPLPEATDNPSGFYESMPLIYLNEQFLFAAKCAWNLCLNFEPDSLNITLTDADRQLVADLLEYEFGDAAGFVMKDPRLCLTLPAWLPALRARWSKIGALIVIRHPFEVVRSLARRNHLPEAYSAPQWLHHVLEAERLTRGLPRAVIFYDELLRDWRRCIATAGKRAGIVWPLPMAAAEQDIDAFLAVSSRRPAEQVPASIGPPHVRELVAATWYTLRAATDDPLSARVLAHLDHIRAEFAHWRHRVYAADFTPAGS